jgi:hypothetical protein
VPFPVAPVTPIKGNIAPFTLPHTTKSTATRSVKSITGGGGRDCEKRFYQNIHYVKSVTNPDGSFPQQRFITLFRLLTAGRMMKRI